MHVYRGIRTGTITSMPMGIMHYRVLYVVVYAIKTNHNVIHNYTHTVSTHSAYICCRPHNSLQWILKELIAIPILKSLL